MPPFATLLPLVRDLVFLRRGPQDLPYSQSLLALLIAAMLALTAALAAELADISVARTAFSMLLQLALVAAALRMGEKSERFVQTATALLSASIVLTLLAIPVLFGTDGVWALDPGTLSRAQRVAVMGALVFQVWDIAITAHILRHALDLKLRFGVLIAVVFLFVDQFVAAAIFERATT